MNCKKGIHGKGGTKWYELICTTPPKKEENDYRKKRKNGLLSRMRFRKKKNQLMEERGGFEPPISISGNNGFQDRRIQPLCHLSIKNMVRLKGVEPLTFRSVV
jgi:hypothetical protein